MLNFTVGFPEIFMLAMTCVVVLCDVLVKQKQQAVTYALTQLTLVMTIVLSFASYSIPATLDFYGMYIHDALASVLKIGILISSVFVLIYSRTGYDEGPGRQGEFYILSLFSILGMMVLVSASNFVTIYLGLELMSLPIYAMVAFDRELEKPAEAAIKYFILGSIASGMLLYGISMVYGATGSLAISTVAPAIASLPQTQLTILILGIVFVVSGIAFKMGVVPFHMWLPDVYSGAATRSTLFIAVAPKIAVFGMTIRLLVEAAPGLHVQWQELFTIIAILSMLVGNIVAIVQTELRRMLAYSTIAHGGYVLLGFVAGSVDGFAASMFYTLTYAIMSLGGFGLLALLDRKGVIIERIEDLRGLNYRNPWLAFVMLLLLFSMAGIPPTAGFFAKVGLLMALVNAHQTWLAIVALLFSIIGSYYYLRLVKIMYFERPASAQPFIVSTVGRIAISINGLAILWLGIFPGSLISLCHTVFN